MTFNADLHIHSSFSSDGEIPPETLVRRAADAGLRCIAVADHDRVNAVTPAVMAGRAAGVIVIPAVEISCDLENLHLHILGYGIDAADPAFADLWERVKSAKVANSARQLEAVENLGIVVDRDAVANLASDGFIIAEYVAEVALADPRNADNPVLEPYRPGNPRSDNPLVNFYWDLCSAGKPGHVQSTSISLDECIAIITHAGGVPVLAHPGQSLKSHPGALPAIARHGVRGVEAYSSYHDAKQCIHWNHVAAANDLFVTCGSDYHGKSKPAIALGGHGAGDDVEELLRPFFEAITK